MGVNKFYMNYNNIPNAMIELVKNYNKSYKTLEDICNLKLDFIHIHPFGDGNGRVSRILLNWALIGADYVPVIIKWEDKQEYIDAINHYGDTGINEKFIGFIARLLINTYKGILEINNEV